MALPSTRSPMSDINSFFDQALADWGLTRPEFSLSNLPSLDLYEKDGKYVAELAVPGYKTEDVNVEVNGNILTISAQHSEERERSGAKYQRREIRRGQFSRSIALPQELDQNSVSANIDRGILTIVASPAKPIANKKIPVSGK